MYFENSSSNPYLIRRIEELNKVGGIIGPSHLTSDLVRLHKKNLADIDNPFVKVIMSDLLASLSVTHSFPGMMLVVTHTHTDRQ